MAKALSEAVRDEMVRLYLAGYSKSKAGPLGGGSAHALTDELARRGIKMRGSHDWARGKSKLLTDKQIAAICSEYRNHGVNAVSLGKEYGVSRTTIQTWLRANGLEVNKHLEKKLSEAEIEGIIKSYESGVSREEISRAVGVNAETIRHYCVDGGAVMRDCRYPRQFDCNHDFFKTFTAESCYAIGFISADGCVSLDKQSVSIGLQIRDRSILEALGAAMSSTYPIRESELVTSKVKDGKPRRYAKITLRSPEMVSDLISLGVTPRKSLTLKPCREIPAEFERDYVRGLIDGDGWVGIDKANRWSVGLCGSLWIVEYFQDYARRLTGSSTSLFFPYERRDFARINYNGKRAPSILAQKLYEGAKIALERKAEKAKILMNYPI
ncbi:MAG: hypothetical protein KY445_07840 [Armatimonadetes bacterium]|nr:hypothetical protein [Armatimonadota bacterium]